MYLLANTARPGAAGVGAAPQYKKMGFNGSGCHQGGLYKHVTIHTIIMDILIIKEL